MIIAKIEGGLGNQLFRYAAARRLSVINNVGLKLDVMSGFSRDFYQRKLGLHHFNINIVEASLWDSYEHPLGRYRREIVKRVNSLLPFSKRSYFFEKKNDFDERMLFIKVQGKQYLDGNWESERYFTDIKHLIKNDLTIITPHTIKNIEIENKISSCNAVSLHVRRLKGFPAYVNVNPDISSVPALDITYYSKAIEFMVDNLKSPHFFCFSDYPEWSKQNLLIDYPITFITNNTEETNYEDLWLMSKCKHHIIANSTFSWWGAWLSENPSKIVIAPDNMYSWGHKGLIPEGWIIL